MNSFPKPQPPFTVDESHHLYNLAVAFHSGEITDPVERRRVKETLFTLHYGNFDLSKVIATAKARNPTTEVATPTREELEKLLHQLRQQQRSLWGVAALTLGQKIDKVKWKLGQLDN